MTEKTSNYIFDMTIYKERRYFSMGSFNGLFELDDNLNPHLIHRFNNYGLLEERLHSNIVAYDDKLFLIPLALGKVGIYNIKSSSYKEIGFNSNVLEGRSYNQAIQNGEKALLIPFELKTPFALLNMEEETIENLCQINDAIEAIIEKNNVTQSFTMFLAALVQDKVYMAVSNIIFMIDTNLWEVDYYMLPECVELKNITVKDKELLITTNDYRMIRWDTCSKAFQILDIPIKGKDTHYPFRSILPIIDGYLFLPAQEEIVLKANNTLDEWNIIQLPKQFCRKVENWSMFLPYEINDKEVVLYPHAGNGFLIYDMNTQRLLFKQMVIEENVLNENRDELFNSGSYVLEGEMTFEEYLSAVEKINN